MVSPEEDLRAASDSLFLSLDRLAALEAEKRTLPPDDPRLVEVADEVRTLASEILATATVQSHLVETAHVMASTDTPGAATRPIDSVHRRLSEILDEWRAAERQLAQAAPGSTEAADALVRARDLRAEYQRAFDEERNDTRDG